MLASVDCQKILEVLKKPSFISWLLALVLIFGSQVKPVYAQAASGTYNVQMTLDSVFSASIDVITSRGKTNTCTIATGENLKTCVFSVPIGQGVSVLSHDTASQDGSVYNHMNCGAEIALAITSTPYPLNYGSTNLPAADKDIACVAHFDSSVDASVSHFVEVKVDAVGSAAVDLITSGGETKTCAVGANQVSNLCHFAIANGEAVTLVARQVGRVAFSNFKCVVVWPGNILDPSDLPEHFTASPYVVKYASSGLPVLGQNLICTARFDQNSQPSSYLVGVTIDSKVPAVVEIIPVGGSTTRCVKAANSGSKFCSVTVPNGTDVTLSASMPDNKNESFFNYYNCGGAYALAETSSTFVIRYSRTEPTTADQNVQCTAFFDYYRADIVVGKNVGGGNGKVAVAIGGNSVIPGKQSYSCDGTGDCVHAAPLNADVTLTAQPDTNNKFVKWACSNVTLSNPTTATQKFKIGLADQIISCQAEFSKKKMFTATLVVNGNGIGDLRYASGADANAQPDQLCSKPDSGAAATCTVSVATGDQLSLLAAPKIEAGATSSAHRVAKFTCSPQVAIAALDGLVVTTVTANLRCTVTLTRNIYTLQIAGEAGFGKPQGSVKTLIGDASAAKSCGKASGGTIVAGPCSYSAPSGSAISLKAVPTTAGDVFKRWSGTASLCANGPTTAELSGTLQTDAENGATLTCTAIFDRPDRTLTAKLVGNGRGSITATTGNGTSWSGCQKDTGEEKSCGQTLEGMTKITLTATATTGADKFDGWTCSSDTTAAGSGRNHTITIAADTECRASFTRGPVKFIMTVAGAGHGTVRVDGDGGITCAKTGSASKSCTIQVKSGAILNITAAPAASADSFASWRCAPKNPGSTDQKSTTIEVVDETTCTATFNATARSLTLALGGPGSGSVTPTFSQSADTLPTVCASNPGAGKSCDYKARDGATASLAATPASADFKFTGWACGVAGATAITSTAPTIQISLNGADQLCTASFDYRVTAPHPGWWWNVDQPGRGYGVDVNVADGRLALLVMTYTNAGDNVWYEAALKRDSETTEAWTGTLTVRRGGQTLFGSWQAAGDAVPLEANDNSVLLRCDKAIECRLTLPAIAGIDTSVPIPITRYDIVEGGAKRVIAVPGVMPESGWWHQPEEPGRGYFVETQADGNGSYQSVIAYLTFKDAGEPRWVVSQNDMAVRDGAAFGTGRILECGGLTLGTDPGHRPDCVPVSSGAMSFAFGSPAAGTMSFDDLGQRIPIQRRAY